MPKRGAGCLVFLFLLALALGGAAAWAWVQAPARFGPPAPQLGPWQRLRYSVLLLRESPALTRPLDPDAAPQPFEVALGEPVGQVAARLEAEGFLADGEAFRHYLVYRGWDVSLQAGRYQLSAAMTAQEIAAALQDPLPQEAELVVLAGWRLEEVAAALPASGLETSPEAFLLAAHMPPTGYDFLQGAASVEGFIAPGAYALPRDLDALSLVEAMVQRFGLLLTPDLREGFARQGLTVYQAVTLASIVQRESVLEEEMPLIASVFYNRLQAGMRLESDPTVQYARGYDAARGGWWPVPLTVDDLQLDSPYNTYRYAGLPPGPIASPGEAALRAVAFPAQTPYYYFRAACDGSGRHLFARTYEAHLQNACP